jgi:hypothetical protein
MTGIVATEHDRLRTLRLLVSSIEAERSEGELRLRAVVADVLGTDAAGLPWRVRRLVVPEAGEDPFLARGLVVAGTVDGVLTDPAVQGGLRGRPAPAGTQRIRGGRARPSDRRVRGSRWRGIL